MSCIRYQHYSIIHWQSDGRRGPEVAHQFVWSVKILNKKKKKNRKNCIIWIIFNNLLHPVMCFIRFVYFFNLLSKMININRRTNFSITFRNSDYIRSEFVHNSLRSSTLWLNHYFLCFRCTVSVYWTILNYLYCFIPYVKWYVSVKIVYCVRTWVRAQLVWNSRCNKAIFRVSVKRFQTTILAIIIIIYWIFLNQFIL